MPPRTIWIVDGAYVFSAAPGKVDYVKLKTELEKLNGGAFYESYYLNSTQESPTEAEQSFHTWLKTAPPQGPQMRVQLYKLKYLRVKCPQCATPFDRHVQKGVDVGIATLMIRLATQNLYDRLVLSAGDGDFEDAISYVKSDLHKEIWISGFTNTVSADLQSYADKVIWIESFWKHIERH
jgi:uncharacterized LabA/DUF88 family protein